MYELGVVYRNIQRADRAAADGLAALGSATVHEAMGRVGLLKPYMRPIQTGVQVSGTAVTVLLQPGDNWMMHVAAEQIRPGDVVVADEARYDALKQALAGTNIGVAAGTAALTEAATRPTDLVLAAIVGTAGLAPTMAALEAANWKIYGAGGAATLLGVKPTTLASRLQTLGIKKIRG